MKDLITTENFFYTVKKALDEKKQFSFVRFSDGETMLMNRKEYYSEYISIINRLWGYMPSEQELTEVSSYLKESINDSDIIGFPTQRHLTRKDYFSKAEEVFEHNFGGMYKFLFASVDVAYEMLYSSKQAETNALYIDYFKELMQDADTVNYVSCRNLDEQFKRVFNIKNVNSFIIRGEAKFMDVNKSVRHYPDQFNQIREWIKTLDCTGQLCLVGGGVPSKIYNTWFKEQGGISLDIGAVADLWSGYGTRGVNRGFNKEYLEYKL